MIESDEVLVEMAKSEPDAFGQLYNKYVARIYSYIYYRTGDVSEAEDLTEKVFFQALTHIARYNNKGVPFSAWLYRIAHNLVANWHRDRSRHPVTPLEGVSLSAGEENGLEEAEERTVVHKAVATLPPERQHLLLLKFVQDLPNAEIGRIMGKSEGAIKALLHRTLKTLREEINITRDGHGSV
ncbi:MAG: polymerase sigma-70 factor, subfamily (modular protein) [Dehalococcoidia bacterium]|nr:polymerase sigma-70 factor, subfamily (modular protein) [Dehalococcoidia bacterium]